MKDCEKLSGEAKRIFGELERYFPKDARGTANWQPNGRIYHGEWFDLRRSEDRKKLEDKLHYSIGSMVFVDAMEYAERHETLDGFEQASFKEMIRNTAGILVLLYKIGVEIETAAENDY